MGEPRPEPPVNAADAHRQQLDCARRMRKARDRQEQAGKAATFLARLAQKEADKATLTERVKKGDNQRERDARIRQTKLDPDLSRRARKVGLRAQFDYEPEDIGDLEWMADNVERVAARAEAEGYDERAVGNWLQTSTSWRKKEQEWEYETPHENRPPPPEERP